MDFEFLPAQQEIQEVLDFKPLDATKSSPTEIGTRNQPAGWDGKTNKKCGFLSWKSDTSWLIGILTMSPQYVVVKVEGDRDSKKKGRLRGHWVLPHLFSLRIVFSSLLTLRMYPQPLLITGRCEDHFAKAHAKRKPRPCSGNTMPFCWISNLGSFARSVSVKTWLSRTQGWRLHSKRFVKIYRGNTNSSNFLDGKNHQFLYWGWQQPSKFLAILGKESDFLMQQLESMAQLWMISSTNFLHISEVGWCG